MELPHVLAMRPTIFSGETPGIDKWRRITAIGIEPSSLEGRCTVYLRGIVENIIGAQFQGPNDGQSGSEETYFVIPESELIPLYPAVPRAIEWK